VRLAGPEQRDHAGQPQRQKLAPGAAGAALRTRRELTRAGLGPTRPDQNRGRLGRGLPLSSRWTRHPNKRRFATEVPRCGSSTWGSQSTLRQSPGPLHPARAPVRRLKGVHGEPVGILQLRAQPSENRLRERSVRLLLDAQTRRPLPQYPGIESPEEGRATASGERPGVTPSSRETANPRRCSGERRSTAQGAALARAREVSHSPASNGIGGWRFTPSARWMRGTTPAASTELPPCRRAGGAASMALYTPRRSEPLAEPTQSTLECPLAGCCETRSILHFGLQARSPLLTQPAEGL